MISETNTTYKSRIQNKFNVFCVIMFDLVTIVCFVVLHTIHLVLS